MQTDSPYGIYPTAELRELLDDRNRTRDNFTIDDVRMLVHSSADPNVQGGSSNAPAVYYACRSSNLELFTYLVSLPDVRLDIVSFFGLNVIHLAAGKDTDEYISAIVEHKRDNLLGVIESRVERLGYGNLHSNRDETPLLYACKSNRAPLSTIQILLDNSADINAINSIGQTALHLTIQSMPENITTRNTRDLEDTRNIIELLLKRGANIDAWDDCQQTAIFECACSHAINNVEVFRLLLYHGANINIPETGIDIPRLGEGITVRRMANGEMREILDEYDHFFNGRQALGMGIGSESQNHSKLKVFDDEIAKMISKNLWISRD